MIHHEPKHLKIQITERGWCVISDLHLSEYLPETVRQFEHFCHNEAASYDVLLIIGDLFEYWVGDDAADLNPAALRVIDAIQNLRRLGVQTYFMRGNRDIAIEQVYCQRAGMSLLADPCHIEFIAESQVEPSLHGTQPAASQHVLFSHGDLLCTEDLEYQRQRAFYAHPWIRKTLLALPLSWRVKLVQHLRHKSRQRWLSTPEHLRQQRMIEQDVPDSAVQTWFEQYHIDTMVHGHTHKPQCHQHQSVTRWVLPDWNLDQAPTRWGFLSARQGHIQLIQKSSSEV